MQDSYLTMFKALFHSNWQLPYAIYMLAFNKEKKSFFWQYHRVIVQNRPIYQQKMGKICAVQSSHDQIKLGLLSFLLHIGKCITSVFNLRNQPHLKGGCTVRQIWIGKKVDLHICRQCFFFAKLNVEKNAETNLLLGDIADKYANLIWSVGCLNFSIF